MRAENWYHTLFMNFYTCVFVFRLLSILYFTVIWFKIIWIQHLVNKIILRCLIFNKVLFAVLDLKCETPMVSLVIDGWTCVGLYREWRKCGHKNTDTIEQQMSRLNDLFKTLKKIKEKLTMFFSRKLVQVEL